jgi:hypothetical protein
LIRSVSLRSHRSHSLGTTGRMVSQSSRSTIAPNQRAT